MHDFLFGEDDALRSDRFLCLGVRVAQIRICITESQKQGTNFEFNGRVSGKGIEIDKERTPEERDDADKDETHVCRDECEVDDLGGYEDAPVA